MAEFKTSQAYKPTGDQPSAIAALSEGLTAGETYVVTANSQRYTFQVPSRVYTLVDNIVDADFTANP